jgi:hypothetical protein
MRAFLLLAFCAIVFFLAPPAHAREQHNLAERVRDGAQRTDNDLESLVKRDKLNAEQRERLDAALKDLRRLRDAVAAGKLDGERPRLERAVENIDSLIKQAPIEEGDRQTLGIDLYSLQVILDSWKP